MPSNVISLQIFDSNKADASCSNNNHIGSVRWAESPFFWIVCSQAISRVECMLATTHQGHLQSQAHLMYVLRWSFQIDPSSANVHRMRMMTQLPIRQGSLHDEFFLEKLLSKWSEKRGFDSKTTHHFGHRVRILPVLQSKPSKHLVCRPAPRRGTHVFCLSCGVRHGRRFEEIFSASQDRRHAHSSPLPPPSR